MSSSEEQDTQQAESLKKKDRSDSPELSDVSMKSDNSMERPPTCRQEDSSADTTDVRLKSKRSPSPETTKSKKMKKEDSSAGLSLIQRERSELAGVSSVSVKSDISMDSPVQFRQEKRCADMRVQLEGQGETRRNMKSVFKEVEHKFYSLVKNQLKMFRKLLSSEYPACSERDEEDEEDLSVREGVMNITLHILKKMKQTDLAYTLQTMLTPSAHKNLKSTLRVKCLKLNEGLSYPGTSVLLNEIYTELYITKGGSGQVNTEHEVRWVETASRRPAAQEKPIKCNDLFKDQSIRTALTKGVAGIGKTVSVQKFILDWAEDQANQDVLFIFPLPFRELNLMKEKKLNLVELLQQFFTDTKDLKPADYHHKLIFIFDGLDECQLPLDFQNNERLCDVTQSASVDVLLTNLIKGNLLPSALLWITTRPAAANYIPPDCIDQVTEIRGFSDPQKEEYFRKRVSDKSIAERIITHIKSSRSLYIMCHIPVFCWISATVLERVLGKAERGEIPKTLTQMFTHFLIFQIKHRDQKYQRKGDTDQTRKIILDLGKLAFEQLEKGNLIFYEQDLTECNIDVREFLVYSGVCTQIFREEFELQLGKVFSFVHLSVQEFLAALYSFLFFISRDETKQPNTDLCDILTKSSMSDFLKSAVDKALQSENGHLDLFLRFLLGLSLESNQTLFKDLLTQTGSISHNNEETVQYIKEKIRENPSPEKTINLFHCLNELNDHSLLKEVQSYLKEGAPSNLSGAKLSPDQWSALAFVMLNSEEELEEFDLSKYDPSEECLMRLLPVLKESRNVVVSGCNITERGCAALVSALKSNPSHLKELNLNYNKPGTSGVKILSDLLQHPICKLEKIHLSGCKLTTDSCDTLCSALQSVNSTLKELDISNNDLQDSGLTLLSTGLRSSYSKLEILRLSGCNLTTNSCEKLVSALQSVTISLKVLDLSNNELKDSGVEFLSVGLQSSHCKLEILRLSGCNITTNSCKKLISALQSVNSFLKELDLSNNDLHDSGVEQLSTGLESSYCKLEILRLSNCVLTKNSCEKFASVLQSVNSSLKELDLSNNDLMDLGVGLLSAGLKCLQCNLKILRLSGCMVTDKGCSSVASALKTNPSHLRELDLSYNYPGESGVKELSNPQCKLEKIYVHHEGEIRMKPGLKKYACKITLDPNTVHNLLVLSDGNRKVERGTEQQPCPDHPDRFEYWWQVLSEESLPERCYWEAEWCGVDRTDISVSYRGIRRKTFSNDCWFGHNDLSWCLICTDNSYSVCHNNKEITLPVHPSGSRTVGVYLDWSAGTLSYYRICPNTPTLTHLHTFTNTFTEPLYAGFKLWGPLTSVRVCEIV